MKKTTKRLQFSTTTVRLLTDDQLAKMAGGADVEDARGSGQGRCWLPRTVITCLP